MRRRFLATINARPAHWTANGNPSTMGLSSQTITAAPYGATTSS